MNIQQAIALFAQVSPDGFHQLDAQITGDLATSGASLTVEQAMFVKQLA